jgi:hypothetical protein
MIQKLRVTDHLGKSEDSGRIFHIKIEHQPSADDQGIVK